LGKCEAKAEVFFPEAHAYAYIHRENFWHGHKVTTDVWAHYGPGCDPKTALAKAWVSTGTYRVNGPEGTTAQLRVVVRETGVAEPPEDYPGPPIPAVPSQGAFAQHDIVTSWTTEIAVTQGGVTNDLFIGSGTLGGPAHSSPGLIVTGDYVGAWYESCTPALCDAIAYDDFSGTTVTVNANEPFELMHDESVTIEIEEPFDGDEAGTEGAASFIVDLELVDQSGTYQLEYIDDELVPTVSEWGLVVMGLLLLVGGKIYFSRWREARWVGR
jgi:hypothetical protein